jgi:hypothetical protein
VAAAFPGSLFFDGERRVAELGTELFGKFLLPLKDVSAIDQNVVLVGRAINADGTELKGLDVHGSTSGGIVPCGESMEDRGRAIRESR